MADDRNSKGQFLPGVSGNPGRKLGSRNKYGERFIQGVAEAYEKFGQEAFRKVAKDKPHEFLKICALVVPKVVQHERAVDGLENDDLDNLIREIADIKARRTGSGVESGESGKDKPGERLN